jgi:hypothetical protein
LKRREGGLRVWVWLYGQRIAGVFRTEREREGERERERERGRELRSTYISI